MTFSVGRWLLIGLSVLIFLGITERVFDRMHLTNKMALAMVAALVVGSFVNVPLFNGENLEVQVNLGGALVPVALALYVWFKAGTTKERVRSLAGALITAGVIFAMGRFLNLDEYALPIDVIYIYPIIAGLLGYAFGRSRKGAFISAVLGIFFFDLLHGVYLIATNTKGLVHFGGGGIFDTIILSGVLAVVLAEVIGETRERLQGGPSSEGRHPSVLKNLKATDEASMLYLEEENNGEEEK